MSIPLARSKAVADGAISFYLDGHVSSRVAPITIGAPSGIPYNAFDPDHLRRISHHRKLPSGRVVVTGGFEVVLEKVYIYFILSGLIELLCSCIWVIRELP